jgi:hypothetical protein
MNPPIPSGVVFQAVVHHATSSLQHPAQLQIGTEPRLPGRPSPQAAAVDFAILEMVDEVMLPTPGRRRRVSL